MSGKLWATLAGNLAGRRGCFRHFKLPNFVNPLENRGDEFLDTTGTGRETIAPTSRADGHDVST